MARTAFLRLQGKLHGQPFIVKGGLPEAVQQQIHVGGALKASTQAGVQCPVGVDQE